MFDAVDTIKALTHKMGPGLAHGEEFNGKIFMEVPKELKLDAKAKTDLRELAKTLTEEAEELEWRSPGGDKITISIKFPKSGSKNSPAAPAAAAATKKKSKAKATQAAGKAATNKSQVKKKAASSAKAPAPEAVDEDLNLEAIASANKKFKIFFFISFLIIPAFITGWVALFFAFKLIKELKLGAVWYILLFIPFVNIITPFLLMSKASAALKSGAS